ncbi:hypothetical protein HN51_051680, partial [Arachis hypogaea]
WNCMGAVDCIDCATNASVVSALNEGILAATEMAGLQKKPWVMINVNDDKDLHIRKAEFDPEDCPANCSRPCKIVCPANAISFLGKSASGTSFNTELPKVLMDGVITERCYGCGRCLPVCPYDKIMGANFPESAAGEHRVQEHRENEEQGMRNILNDYILIYRRMGVEAEKLHIIDKDCIEKGIVELICKHNIKKLVMGAASNKYHSSSFAKDTLYTQGTRDAGLI